MKRFNPKRQVCFCRKGESATEFTPGDFIIVSGTSRWARLIQWGQSLRFRKSRFTKWNHASLIINSHGEIIEADGKGVILETIEKYRDFDYYIVHVEASDADRQQAVVFAQECLNEQYGWGTIAAIAMSLATGLKFSFGFPGQKICSGLVARALERTSAIFPQDTANITPCELATYYLEGGEEPNA